MDERLNRTIGRVNSWDDLRQLESNIKKKGGLSDEIASAIQDRGSALGLALIAEKAGIDVTNLTPAEHKIVRAISEYVGVMRKQGKYPGRTLDQVRNRGLIDAAESAVSRATPTQGYQVLADADLEDLSYERIVLDHPNEFSDRALWYSRRTLGLSNSSEKPPAMSGSDISSRTLALLSWLKGLASGSGGRLPAFSNGDAARAMGMDDAQRYGQVHGNIQSRIDFACYLCDFPPLGCAADVPFGKAWAQQDRDWIFPVAEMQAAAQSRDWSSSDFDRVLRETEALPGQAHLLWKSAFSNDEKRVKDWALRLGEAGGDIGTENAEATPRNPSWNRDELILALNLYLKYRSAPLGKDSEEVAELSEFLTVMGRALGFERTGTFRNVNGVYMKMMNFRRFDSYYISNGKTGLTRGNKDEEIVWGEFADEPERLAAVCKAIRAAVIEHADDYQLAGAEEPDVCDAAEGRVLTRVHRVRERSRKLVEQAKALALKKHGRLVCQACNFDFAKKYGPGGEGLIDVHHTKPVHTLVDGDRTKVEDLALLCANCHRVVHSSRKWLSVAEVAALVRP